MQMVRLLTLRRVSCLVGLLVMSCFLLFTLVPLSADKKVVPMTVEEEMREIGERGMSDDGGADKERFSVLDEQQQQQQPPLSGEIRPEDSDLQFNSGRHVQEIKSGNQNAGGKEDCRGSSMDALTQTMERDITWNEPWPAMEIGVTPPGQVAPAVYYVWCGNRRQMSFQHYLGLLSALRVLKPLKFYFFYTHGQPYVDNLWYNNWFEEFKQFVPIMDVVQKFSNHACGSKEMLKGILETLTAEGGLFLGERVVLAGLPADLYTRDHWFAFPGGEKDLTRGIIFVRKDLTGPKQSPDKLLEDITANRKGCVSVGDLNERGVGEDRRCVALGSSHSNPRDIWGDRTAFGEVARWIFYGRRSPYEVKPDPAHPIPRIAHYVRLQSKDKPMYQDSFSFTHFLSILSSLYVGGFHHVYMHMDKEPSGPWWDLLKNENVTVLKLQKPDFVYQQKITGITHFSDVSRFNILSRHGGAYLDFDCVWTQRLPDSLLEYPVVISPAISVNPGWPDGLALGMVMARPGAPFLRHGFKGYRKYRGDQYLYNAILRSYRTYEQFPDTVRLDPHFAVFCVTDKCHPRWNPRPNWDLKKNGGRDLPWQTQTHALHLVIPKVWKSFESPARLKAGQDMVADVGRNILNKAGRMSILDKA